MWILVLFKVYIVCAWGGILKNYCYYYYYYYYHHHHHLFLYILYIVVYLEQSVFLWYIMLQLFCGYSSYFMQCCSQWHTFCTFDTKLFEVGAQCPVWLFSVVPWLTSVRHFLNDSEMVPAAPLNIVTNFERQSE